MSLRCAVLGSPIGHSRSPALHRAAYAALGLDWRYDAYEVDESGLAAFLGGLDDSWRGLSLTMPLKRVVLPLLDEASPLVQQAAAANTVILQDGRRTGHNTDVGGAVAALRERYDGPVESAVVLGGGATATSLLLALAELGCARATVLVRDPGRVQETLEAVARHPRPPEVEVRRLGTALPQVDVLASTIPVSAQAPALTAQVERAGVVFEVVYDSRPTPIAEAATRAGRTLVTGLDLLLHQAVLQVELMTGRDAPVAAMRAALPPSPALPASPDSPAETRARPAR